MQRLGSSYTSLGGRITTGRIDFRELCLDLSTLIHEHMACAIRRLILRGTWMQLDDRKLYLPISRPLTLAGMHSVSRLVSPAHSEST